MACKVLVVLCVLVASGHGRFEAGNVTAADNAWTGGGDRKGTGMHGAATANVNSTGNADVNATASVNANTNANANANVNTNANANSKANATTSVSAAAHERSRLLEGYRALVGEAGNASAEGLCSAAATLARDELCASAGPPPPAGARPAGKPSPLEVWGLGFAFVTLINLSSVLGVVFLPLMNKTFYKQLLMVMVALAVGSLSASSVFHLIPQALRLADGPSHAYLGISLTVWAGVWAFFVVERVLRIAASRKHSAGRAPLPPKDSSATSTSTDAGDGEGEGEESALARFAHAHAHAHAHHHHHPPVQFRAGKDSAVATVAWMVVFGDGFHNFIDGLSLGAAFAESSLTGVSISVAVLCEELPHELGDFAVLLSAGMSMRQALVANFLSACTCYAGLVLGVLLGEFDASVYVFGFAAGMFLYIALVDMMPELNAAAEEAAKRSGRAAVQTLLWQNLGLLAGAGALYCLARFQDRIQFW